MANNDSWKACTDADANQHISRLDESRFFTRLTQCAAQPGGDQLITTVQIVWQQIEGVTKRVSVDFRDYMLHDMRHLGYELCARID